MHFESVMTSYFEDITKSMKAKFRIPMSLVETHANNIYSVVDTDFTYAQATMSRVRWLKELPYEVNIDETSTTITTLLYEEIDKNAQSFKIFEEEKARITSNLKIEKVDRKKEKIMKRLIETFFEKFEEVDDEQEK